MMRQYELLERVQRYNPQADEDLLNRAYVYAMVAHGNQKRASGDPFFMHPLEVAAILTEFRLDDATIAAALLHDTIEDTATTRAEIDRLFGPQIGQLVDGLTKIKKLDLVSKKAAQAENLRKLLLAVASDVRVLLVKLADRLHNMRTLYYVPKEKRRRVAEETMDIYAPLAVRMGMQDLANELEDLSFRELQSEAYAMIASKLETLREKNAGTIADIEKILSEKLAENGIEAQVKGREKQPCSIWRKIERKGVSFEQLSDIIGLRVIVKSVGDCYQALGVAHMSWPVVPGRFKDYVSTPKQNDYRSIHTTVIGPWHQRVELQIRTEEMHRVAELGIAAHALYKAGLNGADGRLASESRAYEWLRRTIDVLAEGDNPEEFLEHTKLELFQDQVFCFTPKGRLIPLPRGATPIDFAYAVHTDIGNTCVGAKINGRLAPLVSRLNNGDEVEVICAKGQSPPPVWETLVVTGKARAAIRRASRGAVREQFSGLGRQILKGVFKRAGKTYTDETIAAVLPRLARTSVEDVLAAVGRQEMDSSDVIKAVYPDFKEEAKTKPANAEEGWFGLKSRQGLKFRVPGKAVGGRRTKHGIPIRGLKGDLPVKFAPNGGAVPGDRIVGILFPGEGITIFPIHSPELQSYDDQPERWLDVRWDIDEDTPERFPAQIRVSSINEPGSLAQIAQIIGDNDANIDNLAMTRLSHDFHEIVIHLEVFSVKHLNAIISQLKSRPVVSSVARVNG